MDFNYLSSRVCPSKHLSAFHAGLRRPDNHRSVMDDSDGDDDGRRAYFPCPFCYVDIELPLICSHLHEEHCFDFKNAVCPLCASDPGKDVIGHFITHHPSSLKRKREEKSAALAMLAKKLQSNGRGSGSESSPDPLLSPFICSTPKEIPKEDNSGSSATNNFESIVLSTEKENHEESAEKIRRADFVQQLITSTISWSSPESQHLE